MSSDLEFSDTENSDYESAKKYNNKSKCSDCNRYMDNDDNQKKWSIDFFFNRLWYDENVAYAGGSGEMCRQCEQSSIFNNRECNKCGGYFLEDYQKDWDLEKTFADRSDWKLDLAANEGDIPGLCVDCETDDEDDDEDDDDKDECKLDYIE